MEVVCGSYESMVFGCKLRKVQQEYDFELSFCDNSHIGNVKAIAVSDNGLLATGSSDENIKLKNLKTRKEVGSISQHEGSISALTFFGKSHLFSASDDGNIIIWKVGSWESLRVLRGHKSAVYDVAVHPSGKIAVSVSKDKSMRTWNLVTGKCAFVTNIKIAADQVIWLPNGERFIVVHDRTMDVYGVQSGKVEQSITHQTRINALSFIEDGVLLASGEGGVVYFYNTEDYSKVYEFPTETVRVKGMHCCQSEEGGAVWLLTGSADGMLKLWTLTCRQGKWSHQLDASKDFGYRITSMAVRLDRKHLEGEKNTNNNKASTSNDDHRNKRNKKQQTEVIKNKSDISEKPPTKKRKVEVEEEESHDGWIQDIEDDADDELLRKVPAGKINELERTDSTERAPKQSNSIKASIIEFMKISKEEEEEDDDEDETDKESSANLSHQSSNEEDEGSWDDSSSDDTIDGDLMSYVDFLDSIDEVDEEEYVQQELREKQMREKGQLDDLPDFQRAVSAKASKKSIGRVSSKASKKSLVSSKSSKGMLKGSCTSSVESLPVSVKKSKKSIPSASPQASVTGKMGKTIKAKASKESIMIDSPSEGSQKEFDKKEKVQMPKIQKKSLNKNEKCLQEPGKKSNKKGLKNNTNELKKSVSCPLQSEKSKPLETNKRKRRRKAKQQ